MNRDELRQLIEQCILGNISESTMIQCLHYNNEKLWRGGHYIYLENIALRSFYVSLESHFSQGCGFHENQKLFFDIKQILSGEKSHFFTLTLRMPSGEGYLPNEARWLLDLVYDTEWSALRKLITEYRETRFLDFDIREKYEEMAKMLESKTIIDIVKKILYDNIAATWWLGERKKGKFYPGLLYGKEAEPLDYTNKLLKMIDCCEGKSFFIVAVNYLNGQPNISITS